MTIKKSSPLVLLIIAGMFIIAGLSACTPDPRREAQAFQIHEQAEQDALNQAQNRAHADELHLIQVQQSQAIAQETIAAWNRSIKFISIFGTISVCIVLIAMAISFSYGSIRFAHAAARRADIQATLIQLDPTTRQFPLVLQHVHGSKYALHNPNVGSVLMLDENNPADRQLIATAGATQIAGVIAQEARQSIDPAGVAIIQPPVVDVHDGDLTVGIEVRRRNE
jgi:hypothetical protein